jgi:hypothetical protein
MKNGKPRDWESRLERLEADVNEIKAILQAHQQSKRPWWEEMVGVFSDPVSKETVKLGLEEREKDRRKTQRMRTKAKKHA